MCISILSNTKLISLCASGIKQTMQNNTQHRKCWQTSATWQTVSQLQLVGHLSLVVELTKLAANQQRPVKVEGLKLTRIHTHCFEHSQLLWMCGLGKFSTEFWHKTVHGTQFVVFFLGEGWGWTWARNDSIAPRHRGNLKGVTACRPVQVVPKQSSLQRAESGRSLLPKSCWCKPRLGDGWVEQS